MTAAAITGVRISFFIVRFIGQRSSEMKQRGDVRSVGQNFDLAQLQSVK